jgi:hypothetical protein
MHNPLQPTEELLLAYVNERLGTPCRNSLYLMAVAWAVCCLAVLYLSSR